MSVELANLDDNSKATLAELKKKLTVTNVVKTVFGTLASFGAAGAVVAMMRNPIKAAHGLTKLCISLGVFTLGCKAGEVVDDCFKEMVDSFDGAFKEFKQVFLTEGETENGTDSEHGRDSKQLSEKQRSAGSKDGEAPASAVRWGRWRKKKASE